MDIDILSHQQSGTVSTPTILALFFVVAAHPCLIREILTRIQESVHVARNFVTVIAAATVALALALASDTTMHGKKEGDVKAEVVDGANVQELG
mmetsp:Transcript_49/g.116  ORF Transcript_49/g.116 Transcript_49/m.116 type:complete len:94 (+) Transcript_49:178-459(+)